MPTTINERLDKLYVCKECNACYLFSSYIAEYEEKPDTTKALLKYHRHMDQIVQGYYFFLTRAIEPANMLPAIKNAKYGLPEPNASDERPAMIGPAVHPVPNRVL